MAKEIFSVAFNLIADWLGYSEKRRATPESMLSEDETDETCDPFLETESKEKELVESGP